MASNFTSSDIAKYRFRRYLSGRNAFYFFAVFLLSFIFGFLSTQSSSFVKEEISNCLASVAESSETKGVHLQFVDSVAGSFDDYTNIYAYSRDLLSWNPNQSHFSVYSGYFANNKYFSDEYSYSSNVIFGDWREISILPSPFNSIVNEGGVFKHEIWGLNLMFSYQIVNSSAGVKNNFFYLPESAARSILVNKGISDPDLEDFRTLLGSTVPIYFQYKEINETIKVDWCVANIIFEDDVFSKFSERFGDFLACNTRLPSYMLPCISLDFGHSSFAISNFLKRINDYFDFSSGRYSYSVINVNDSLVNNDNINEMISSFYSDGISISVVIILEVLVALFFAIIFYKSNINLPLFCFVIGAICMSFLGSVLLVILIGWSSSVANLCFLLFAVLVLFCANVWKLIRYWYIDQSKNEARFYAKFRV